MDEIWTEALQNYLLSQDFQENVQKFVKKQAYLFDGSNQAKDADFDHRHHKVWKEFQDIVETMLEKVLEDLGGNFQALEKALDERASEPPRGPRDAAEKEVLAQLLTFDDFTQFAHMMQRVARGGKEEADFQQDYADTGEGAGGEYGYDDGGEEDPRRRRKQMAKQLHEFGFERELCKQAVLKFDDFDSCVAWCCDQNADNNNDNSGGNEGSNDDYPDPIDSARNNPEEFEIQCIMAQSVLEAQSAGTLPKSDEAILPWANTMVELATLMRSCDFDTNQLDATYQARVEELRVILQREQETMDAHASAQPESRSTANGSAAGGGEVAEMSEEDRERERRRVEKIMENASKAEQDLAAMLTRVDELQKITEKQRDKVTIYTRPPQSVKNDNLEEIYLFIKEMVHGGQDLAENKDKIHDYVFERIESSAANLVPSLLELMLQEEEMVMLNRHIRKALDPSAASAEAGAEENEDDDQSLVGGEGGFTADDDASVGTTGTLDDEDNLSELERLNQKYQRDQAALEVAMERERQRQRRLLEERMRRRREKMRAQGYSEEDIEALEEKDRAALEERLNMLEKGLNNGLARKHEAVVKATAKAKRALSEEEVVDTSKEMLEMMKKKYFEEEDALRKLINGERNRQKNRLRDRLRKSREKKLAKYRAEGMSEEELQKVEERLVAEEEAKIQQLDESFDRQIEKALAAPKQRYYGALMAPTVVLSELQHSSEGEEPDDDEENWLKALQDIKDRHDSQAKSLSEQMAAERRRKQNLLRDRMAKKKRLRKTQLQEMGASDSEIEKELEAMEAELAAELEAVDQEVDKQLREATASMAQAHQFELVSFTKTDNPDYSSYLEQIRSGNLEDRTNMENVMASEKERQKAELQERMQKRKEARLKKLQQKGADDAALAEAEAELEEEEKQEAEQFEAQQRKMLDMMLGAEDQQKMMEQINAEAAHDSNALKLSVEEEKRRQKEEMKRKLAEKKAKKLAKLKAKGAAEAELKAAEEEANKEAAAELGEIDDSETGGGQEEQQPDISEQMQKIVKENEEEREKMELVMQMEQARQRQAMQAKLMAKRERRRKKAAKADAARLAASDAGGPQPAKTHFVQPLSNDAKAKIKKMPTLNANTMKYMQQRGWGV